MSGLPLQATHPKYAELQAFIIDNKIDVLCLSELNIAWHNLQEEQQFSHLVRPWFQSTFTKVAWHTDRDWSSPLQRGGVGLLVRDSHTGRVCGSGSDPSGLGRWVWVRLRGHHGSLLRIVSAYRPVLNPRDAGSTWNQHSRVFESSDPPRLGDPRQLFLDDLQVMLQSAYDSGEQILLALDANEPLLWTPANVVDQAMAPFSMPNLHFHRHDRATAPPTHNRGSRPIDAMFGSSPSLTGSQCGYFSFGEAPGDHRALWVDIPLVEVFGVMSAPVAPRVARRLQCRDPRVVRRYQTTLHEFYSQHDVQRRTFLLEQSITGPLSEEQALEWERLDALRVQGIFLADSKCRKLRTGAVPWSPILARALAVHRFWDRLYTSAIGRHVSPKFLRRLATKAGLELPSCMPVDEILLHRQTAWAEYKRLKRDAPHARQAFLHSLIDARAAAGWDSAKSGLANLLRREQQRQDARTLRQVLAPTSRKGLTEVQLPSGPGAWVDGEWDGAWVTRTDRDGMETGCLAENNRRFRQASDTDLLQPALVQALGPTGTSAYADQLLTSGDPSRVADLISPEAAVYLSHHRRPSVLVAPHPFDLDFRTPAYCASWQKMDEYTASGPSGLHFGHFMANSLSPSLGSVDAALGRIPSISGYLPVRWQQGLNVMLEKKPGVVKVSKLRTILLYEADFNHNNKLMGRSMMRYAEANSLLAPEQYGSRRGHSAIYQCLNKVLTFDLMRQTRRPGGLCSNDAKSCYDRIGHSSAGLAMQRCGVPPSLVDASLGPIQHLRHFIRTAYGDSTTSFSAAGHLVPVQGIGQGNGAGPAIWAVVSTPIFNAMRQRGYGLFLRSPHSGSSFLFVGYAFVDDTDLVVDGVSASATATQVAERLQASANFWEASLRASGGALSPAKCHWYLVDHRWHDGQWRLVAPADSPATLRIRSPSGRVVPIERVSPMEARKTLGVWTAPDGSMKAEYAYLESKVKNWTERICVRTLPHHLVWMSLHTGIFKTLQYPLAATTFSEAECRSLCSPLLKIGLSRSHIVRSMPRPVVHGPQVTGGFAVPDLYVEQAIAHLTAFISFGHSESSITGFLLRNTLEFLQLELGTAGNPLALNFQDWSKCAVPTWCTSLWSFCSRYSVALSSPIPAIPILRAGDSFLMAAFWSAGIRNPTALARLNACRMFLRAFTLADITSVDGRYILLDAWTGSGPCSRRPHLEWWPRSPPTSALAWHEWREALMSTFGVEARFRRVVTTLGSWEVPSVLSSLALFCPHWNRLCLPRGDGIWQLAIARPSLRGRPVFDLSPKYLSVASLALYPPLFAADIYGPSASPILLYTDSVPVDLSVLFPPPPSTPVSFDWGCPVLAQVTPVWFIPPSDAVLSRIVSALHLGQLAAFSDGSARESVAGTCAWGIATTDSEVAVLAAGFRIPGPVAAHCSFRSELAGVIGIASLLRCVARWVPDLQGTVHFATDSDSVLGRVFRRPTPATVADHSWDLLSYCRFLLDGLPAIHWHGFHVKGHQDQGTAQLDIWARRNIYMDSCASAVYSLVSPNCFPSFPTAPLPSLSVGEKEVVSSLAATIREHVLRPPLVDHWQRLQRFGRAPSSSVDWAARSLALGQLQQNRRHWVIKHTATRSAVGVEMVRRRKWRDPRCPRCGAAVESADHVLQCSHPEAKALWHEALARLDRWMALRHTQPTVARFILDHLRAWVEDTEYVAPFTSVPGLREAVTDQAQMGWTAAVMGFWSNHWAEIQQAHYRFLGKRYSGRRWLALLIQQIWNTSWDQWEHRNAIYHANGALRLHAERQDAIRLAYSGPLRSTPLLRLLFRRPLERRLQDPPHIQQAFLRRLSTPIVSAAARSLRRQQRAFRSFFLQPRASSS